MSREVARFYDDEGNLREELDPENAENTCYGYKSGATSEMCGGCDGCLLMQAVHYGAEFKWETVDD